VFADDGNGDTLLEGSETIDIPKDKVATGGAISMQHVPSDPTPAEIDVANFDGTWIIDYNPDRCALPNLEDEEEYRSIISQTGDHAEIYTTIRSRPDIEIRAPSCTVRGNELTCASFTFFDREEWKHVYSDLTLWLDVYNYGLTGQSNYSIYTPNNRLACQGTASYIGERVETSENDTGE